MFKSKSALQPLSQLPRKNTESVKEMDEGCPSPLMIKREEAAASEARQAKERQKKLSKLEERREEINEEIESCPGRTQKCPDLALKGRSVKSALQPLSQLPRKNTESVKEMDEGFDWIH